MNQIIYRFNFNETNFLSEKQKINDLINHCFKKHITFKFRENVPPCIINKKITTIQKNDRILLNEKNILIIINVLFGEQYKDINKMFHESPFISMSCKKCKEFKQNKCRGLFNEKFIKIKYKLISKFNHDTYYAIQSDFENGMFVYGSTCNSNCKFCIDKFVPNNITRFVPSLNSFEIMHFLHYLPTFLSIVGCSFHCKSGEFFDSEYADDLLKKIIPLFLLARPNLIITNGLGITNKIVKKLEEINSKLKQKIELGISINSLDPEYREFFSLPKINFKKILSLLKKSTIKYQISIIPFKKTIESKDVTRTIREILNIDPKCSIRIQKPNPNIFMEQQIINEFDLNYDQFKLDIKTQFLTQDLIFIDEDNLTGLKKLDEIIFKTKQFIEIERTKKTAILIPENTFPYFETLKSKQVFVFKVVSELGFKNSSAGILRISDYINSIKNQNLFDNYILPRTTFTINFDDFTLNNINMFWNKLDKTRSSIILI